MDDMEKLGIAALEALAQKAEPTLKQKLAEFGVSDPNELPPDVAKKIFIDAMTQAAAVHMPGADPTKFRRGFENFSDPLFLSAHKRLSDAKRVEDAFLPASGPDAAIVMAAVGVEVAPLDKKNLQILRPFSNSIKETSENFTNLKTAYVGYSVVEAAFYILSTDCLITLKNLVDFDRRFESIKHLLDRSNGVIPNASEKFTHFVCAFARHEGDRIATVAAIDDHPDRGSVILHAGWIDENGPQGSPQGGIMPVPHSLVKAVIADPRLAYWLTQPHDAAPMLMN